MEFYFVRNTNKSTKKISKTNTTLKVWSDE